MSILHIILIHLVEIIAAVAGTIYCYSNKENRNAKYLTYFLWFTVLVETIGLLPRLIVQTDFFAFLKDTFWVGNYWLYNSYLIISVVFYVFYIVGNMNKAKRFKYIQYLITGYVISSVINLILSGVFFKSYSAFNFVTGSIVILMVSAIYFYEVLQSDKILKFNNTLAFYIVFAILIFHLCVTPLFIYSKYYNVGVSRFFTEVYTYVLTMANLFLYMSYTLGFIICLKKKKSY